MTWQVIRTLYEVALNGDAGENGAALAFSSTPMTTRRAPRPTPAHDFLLPAIGAANVLAVATAVLFVVPSFATMYEGLGGDLPASTRLLLATYRSWALLAFAVPLIWSVCPDRRSRGLVGLIAGSLIAVLLIAFGWWACYAPVFALAARIA
ncbi:MAG: hypothetical protein AMXMBFR59_20860 [Rhodanobacteraceae bacterium]